MSFSPRDNFIRFHEAHANALRPIVQQPFYLTACNFAMSQMANDGATAEQIAGARMFIREMGIIGNPPDQPAKFPVSRLSADDPNYKPGRKSKTKSDDGSKKEA